VNGFSVNLRFLCAFAVIWREYQTTRRKERKDAERETKLTITSRPNTDFQQSRESWRWWGDPSRETVSHLHTWLIKDFAIQSNHGSPELRSTGEAEESSAGEQLTEE
jgi:hypothetical protein